MQLTPEEVQTGKDNFNEALAATRGGDSTFEDAVALSRRSFMKGAAGAPGWGRSNSATTRSKATRYVSASSVPVTKATCC